MLPIRFINLDRATERRRFMEAQGEAFGLALERVRAVEGGDVAPDRMARLAASWQRPMRPGEVACFLSHRGQWERVAGEGRPAIVLEDDALLSRRFKAALRAIEAIEGADLLNLEDVGRRRFLGAEAAMPLGEGVAAVPCRRDKAGAGAYVLWPAGARRLLALSEGRAALADSLLHGSGLRALVAEPPLSIQLSVLEERGRRGPIDGRSLLQVPGERAPRRGLVYGWRRLQAQIALLPHHLSRLNGTHYRRVRVEDADFPTS